jgi:xylitol oxidase
VLTNEWNWARNRRLEATGLVIPASVEELADTVAGADHIRALGSRHSFTDIADSPGLLVSLAALPPDVEIDSEARVATVAAGMRYGDVARALHDRGWALAAMASLPHISVAGAVATGTHGSGDRTGSLAASVTAVEAVTADGSLARVVRGEQDFDGSVVALGALGVVTRLTLEVEPAYPMRQDVFLDLPWEVLESDLGAVTGAAQSVSMFTDFAGESVRQVWLKSRGEAAPEAPRGTHPAAAQVSMLPGGPPEPVTEQLGTPGLWLDRLPHFRLGFTPSRGEELQSEYLLPRDNALDAIGHLRRLAPRLGPVLQVAEIRTVASDPLWLSSSYGTDVVGFHFTWVRDHDAVYAVLPLIEDALLPLGARPHWGKCFVAAAAELEGLYPRLPDFRTLRERVDPTRKFANPWLERVVG